jgi:hypothetical protein
LGDVGEAADLDRCEGLCGGAVAELAFVVEAPAADGAVVEEGTAVVVAGSDALGVGEAGDGDGR